MYAADADSNASYWISTQERLDPWLSNYFTGATRGDFNEFYPGRGNIFWKNKAPAHPLIKGKVEVLQDSSVDLRRRIKLRVTPDSTSRGFRVYFLNNVMPVALNERVIEPSQVSDLRYIQFFASTPGGTTIELEMLPDEPLDIRIIEQRPGLPGALLKVPLPENFIYSPDYISNSTQVKYQLKI
jgi:hypothetical protein